MRLRTHTPTGNTSQFTSQSTLNPFLKGMQTETALTENGAVTNPTTLNPLLDLFFIAGASRSMSKSEIEGLVGAAYAQDPLATLKILFWARDVRGGAGERRFFRIAMNHLVDFHHKLLPGFQALIPTFGRWDDLWLTENMGSYTKNLDAVAFHIAKLISTLDFSDLNNMLLCKWLPRKGDLAVKITKELRWSHKQYRKFLVKHTQVVEHFMSAQKWEDIDFSKVPSKAFNKYKKAFERHTPEEFKEFIDSVLSGDTKLNAKALFPHEITYQARTGRDNARTLQAQWDSLAQYKGAGSVIPVVDVSGSMESWLPDSRIEQIDISIALGIYFAENIEGPFKDHIISFSGRPNLHRLSGSIVDKTKQSLRSGEDWSTNLVGVFECVLNVAKRDNLKQSDMPQTFVIFSDMEFNAVGGNMTNYNKIKQMYEEAGYEMPNIVFWNLNGRLNNYPVQGNTPNTALLSGYSPSLMKIILNGSLNPEQAMMDAINNKRYDIVEETFHHKI